MINRIGIIEKISFWVRSLRSFFLRRVMGYRNIHVDCIIEGGVLLDKIYPENIFIERGVLVARGSVILSHEHVAREQNNENFPKKFKTVIGENSFIGINAIICPGVTIGKSCIIAAGSVVTTDVPSNCLAAGVPATVKKEGLKLKYGAILER